MIEGFLLGLSMGLFCLGWCLPALLPYLISEKRTLKESFKIFLQFLAGRFLSYLSLGFLVGYLGQKISFFPLEKLSFLFLSILGFILILFGIGQIKRKFLICQFFRKMKVPFFLGFFLGFTICPPFLTAIFYAFSLKNFFLSILFFLSFFIGSSFYQIFLLFFGEFSTFNTFQKVGQISSIFAGLFFLAFGLKNFFSFSQNFLCPFSSFHLPFFHYPIEIFLLIFATIFSSSFFFLKKYSLFPFRYFFPFSFFILAFLKFPQFCPFLTLQELAGGKFINIFSLLFFVLILITTLIFGRIFCGWICPISFFQEIIFKVRQKIKKFPQIFLPQKISNLKFLFLILILIFPFLSKSSVLCKRDPFGFLFGFFKTPLSFFLLFLLIFLSLFIYLPFCRIFCPIGAILALLSKISIFKLEIKKENCKNCGVCEKSCPLQIISQKEIDNSECIRCGKCFQKCQFSSIKFKL